MFFRRILDVAGLRVFLSTFVFSFSTLCTDFRLTAVSCSTALITAESADLTRAFMFPPSEDLSFGIPIFPLPFRIIPREAGIAISEFVTAQHCVQIFIIQIT